MRGTWKSVCLATLVITPHSESKVRAEAPAPVRLAVTVDDLPANPSPAGHASAAIVGEIARTLRAQGVTSATGFVIGSRIEAIPDARDALDAWIAAGYELGNHTYAHPSLHREGVYALVHDLARMEPLMRALERRSGQARRYFRFPYLEEARDGAGRRQLSRALSRAGYLLARVSVDFDDWAWAEAHARCLARGDAKTLARLSRSYVESAAAHLAWAEASAARVLRRPLTHVLLLHATLATAHNLGALLRAYERAGVSFVPLAEALSDPLYTAPYEGDGGNVLTLASAALGRPRPPHPEPPALLESACRERAASTRLTRARPLRMFPGMARMVNCVKLGREAEGMDKPPIKGELGQRVYENVSRDGWRQWIEHSTMLINELRLDFNDPKAQKIWLSECEKFFFGEGSQKPEGYVPPEG